MIKLRWEIILDYSGEPNVITGVHMRDSGRSEAEKVLGRLK